MNQPITTDKAPTLREIVQRAITECTDPLGARPSMLCEATGIPSKQVSASLHHLLRFKYVTSIPCGQYSRYFPTAEAAEQARPAVIAWTEAEIKRRLIERKERQRNDPVRREKEKKRLAARREREKAARPPKAPKPAKAKKAVAAKPSKFTGVTVSHKAIRSGFGSNDKPIITAATKVTICPAGIDMRFKFVPPHPGWKGEISKDWEQRTAQQQRRTACDRTISTKKETYTAGGSTGDSSRG